MNRVDSSILVWFLLVLCDAGRHDCDDGCAPMWEYPAPAVDAVVRMPGESASLKCRAFGNPRPQVSWLRNNGHLDTSNGKHDLHRWGLTLNDLMPQDSGLYTCVAENDFGHIQWSYLLTVHESIANSMFEHAGWPLNLTTHEGRTAMFECHVTLAEDAAVTWIRREGGNGSANSDIGPDDVILKHSIRNGPDTLILTNVTLRDAGQYTCVVKAPGQTIQRSAWLEVLPGEGQVDSSLGPRIQEVKDRGTRVDTSDGPSSFLRGIAIAIGTVVGFIGVGMALVCLSAIYRSWEYRYRDKNAPVWEEEETEVV